MNTRFFTWALGCIFLMGCHLPTNMVDTSSCVEVPEEMITIREVPDWLLAAVCGGGDIYGCHQETLGGRHRIYIVAGLSPKNREWVEQHERDHVNCGERHI